MSSPAPCPSCGRSLPGPAALRLHIGATHSAAANDAARALAAARGAR